jgi:hypothetical protein
MDENFASHTAHHNDDRYPYHVDTSSYDRWIFPRCAMRRSRNTSNYLLAGVERLPEICPANPLGWIGARDDAAGGLP